MAKFKAVKTCKADRKIASIRRMFERAKRRRRMVESCLHILLLRRMQVIQIATMLMLILLSGRNAFSPIPRSCRRLPRNTGWWNLIWNTYSNARFKKTFRVSRETFTFILGRIRHVLERKSVVEEPILPEHRLAVCLYRLGRGSYYYTIAEMTGLGVSTVCTITEEVCEAIIQHLWKESVDKFMPHSEQEFVNKIVNMEEMWQFPCCWGALDGCHIPIKCPPGGLESCKEYHNFKNFYSVVLMAMVDSNYRFIWGSCGYPGNSHDSVIFQSTDLWAKIQNGSLLPKVGKKIGTLFIPPLVIADSAFPFMTWLRKPFTDAVLSEKQRYFNYRLSRARMVTESAYGQLKGRWRVLLRKCESSSEKVRINALACMVLHNICIDRKDSIPKKLDLSIDPSTNEKRDSTKVRELLQMRACRRIKDSLVEAGRIRSALVEKLWLEKQTGEVC